MGILLPQLAFDPGTDAAIAVLTSNDRSLTTERIGEDVIPGRATPFGRRPPHSVDIGCCLSRPSSFILPDPFRSRDAPERWPRDSVTTRQTLARGHWLSRRSVVASPTTSPPWKRHITK